MTHYGLFMQLGEADKIKHNLNWDKFSKWTTCSWNLVHGLFIAVRMAGQMIEVPDKDAIIYTPQMNYHSSLLRNVLLCRWFLGALGWCDTTMAQATLPLMWPCLSCHSQCFTKWFYYELWRNMAYTGSIRSKSSMAATLLCYLLMVTKCILAQPPVRASSCS